MDLYEKFLSRLETKKRILFLTTSNRWSGEKDDIPKSTLLARKTAENLGKKDIEITLIDVPDLNIYACEGNISTKNGNTCGQHGALLKDGIKNPSGCHRCWASINNPDDELWKISRALLQSDCVVFFGSVRWGQMNSFYQKLIERLTWLENRHSTLGEDNILKDISAGIFITGHNWKEEDVLDTQKKVLTYFGFDLEEELCLFWRYTDDPTDESPESYEKAWKKFMDDFRI